MQVLKDKQLEHNGEFPPQGDTGVNGKSSQWPDWNNFNNKINKVVLDCSPEYKYPWWVDVGESPQIFHAEDLM